MDDLIAWLRVQIDEDEGALTGPHRLDNEYCSDGAHWTDERVLAECEAKRRLIDRYVALRGYRARPYDEDGKTPEEIARQAGYSHALEVALADMASPYVAIGRPGYREEWRP